MSEAVAAIVVSVLALAMSGIGIWVAVLARRDSGRSACAAEKSAIAAEKSVHEAQHSRRIAKADLLVPLFRNADYLFEVAEGSKGQDYKRWEQIIQSTADLRTLLQDEKLQQVLDEVIFISGEINKLIPLILFPDTKIPHQKIDDLNAQAKQLRPTYEGLKSKYLNIG